MDPLLLTLANRMVGNPPGAAAIEWALGPGAFRCSADTLIAVLGGVVASLDGLPVDPPQPVFTARRGVTVSIAQRPEHRFTYIAAAGGIAVPALLGSRSTYLPGGIGGHRGRLLRRGDRLPLGRRGPAAAESFVLTGVALPAEPPAPPDLEIRITRGPQWSLFGERAHEVLLSSRYDVARSSDRLGYRLDGPALHPRGPATLPSEAACPGAVQIPDGGRPIVIMPDGPTVGGYAKIGVVVRADLRQLAQAVPERGVRFREVSLEEARACYSEGR
jgi:biotin-dependent carboxylase-like uncharacterized protein